MYLAYARPDSGSGGICASIAKTGFDVAMGNTGRIDHAGHDSGHAIHRKRIIQRLPGSLDENVVNRLADCLPVRLYGRPISDEILCINCTGKGEKILLPAFAGWSRAIRF